MNKHEIIDHLRATKAALEAEIIEGNVNNPFGMEIKIVVDATTKEMVVVDDTTRAAMGQQMEKDIRNYIGNDLMTFDDAEWIMNLISYINCWSQHPVVYGFNKLDELIKD